VSNFSLAGTHPTAARPLDKAIDHFLLDLDCR
jgi:hypothetical protein